MNRRIPDQGMYTNRLMIIDVKREMEERIKIIMFPSGNRIPGSRFYSERRNNVLSLLWLPLLART